MIAYFLRVVAGSLLVAWLAWQITAEPPFILLLLAFVSAWGLMIDWFIRLPREIEGWRRARREK